jgi:hypothetical protein
MANRSLSAVPSVSGATVTKLSVVKESPFARWRSATQGGGGRGNDRSASVNRSHDDLSRLGGAESLDEESLLGAAPDSCTVSLGETKIVFRFLKFNYLKKIRNSKNYAIVF